MWEAIESNRRRSWVLISAMGVLLIALGAFIGMAVHPRAGLGPGILVAGGVWLVLWMVAWFQGDAVMLSSARAMKIERADAPQLWNVVEEMCIASGTSKMPDVYLIDDPSPNAFAIGRNPDKRSAVAVTSGLLRILNRDELQGVVAHEIGHLKNRDSSFLVLAGVMMGAIVLIADLFLRGLFYGGRGRRSSKGGGQAQAVLLILALVVAILAPLLAQMLYFACSRRREYLADASSARFTRYPEGLASALEKISSHHVRKQEVNRVLAPMYIVNPGMAALAAIGLFSTHPPTVNRIRVLRNMGGAGYGDYESAFKKVVGTGGALIGRRTLEADKPAPVRAAAAAEQKKEAVERSHDVIQLLGRLENLIVMTCACGLGIKVPPRLNRDAIPCPRCGRSNPIPKAQAAAPAPDAPLQYRRQGTGWESVKCACGWVSQLSPHFAGAHVTCLECKRRIEIIQ